MEISFLITHYNRIEALTQCINSITNEVSNYKYEIVVSDDGSTDANIEKLKKIKIDTLVLDSRNRGLGININKGLRNCNGKYIFYIQEDFIISKDISKLLKESISLLNDGKLDLVRFYTPYNFKNIKKISPNFYRIKNWSINNFYFNQFLYSDWPHLKTNNFHGMFGYYKENVKVLYTENEYMIRMMHLKPKIGACYINVCEPIDDIKSVREDVAIHKKRNKFINLLRAFRFNFEMILYNEKTRKLKTFKFSKK